ncbi:gamma-glutamyltransferase [Kineococcus gynurae]|uniref:Gamma-glutamyltransferase n=1 Tax=Kineococcus gynurae TaxID=452979 RepID=A0ABV5LRU5_9ACTN
MTVVRTLAGEDVPLVAPGCAVAGPNLASAEAGEELAEAGGNAVDCALAAIVAALVSEPGIASLGGGAFVTVTGPGIEPVTVDGSVAMPGLGLPPEAFGHGLDPVHLPGYGDTRTEVGPGSVATPGTLRALELASHRFGRLPFASVLRPAARIAREGFTFGRAADYYLGHARESIFERDPAVRAVLTGEDGPAAAGDRLRLPELGDFLDEVAREGSRVLHEGEVAVRLVEGLRAGGGILTLEDLSAYTPVLRPALRIRTGGWEWATNPPPSVGGTMLAAMLLLADGVDRDAGWDDRDLVAVERAVLARRIPELDLARDRTAAAQALIDDIAAHGPEWLHTSPSTVHVSAVDSDGTACAVTASSGYGCGLAVPGTGIWLNNCLGERELNRRGVHALAPGERLVSNMTPTVGRRADGTVLAIGSPGADRIATAVFQTLLALGSGADLDAAIGRPRVHVTCTEDGTPQFLEAEADVSLAPEDADGLPVRRHAPHSMFFGGVAAARRGPDGRIGAAADPRREGAVAVAGPGGVQNSPT